VFSPNVCPPGDDPPLTLPSVDELSGLADITPVLDGDPRYDVPRCAEGWAEDVCG